MRLSAACGLVDTTTRRLPICIRCNARNSPCFCKYIHCPENSGRCRRLGKRRYTVSHHSCCHTSFPKILCTGVLFSCSGVKDRTAKAFCTEAFEKTRIEPFSVADFIIAQSNAIENIFFRALGTLAAERSVVHAAKTKKRAHIDRSGHHFGGAVRIVHPAWDQSDAPPDAADLQRRALCLDMPGRNRR